MRWTQRPALAKSLFLIRRTFDRKSQLVCYVGMAWVEFTKPLTLGLLTHVGSKLKGQQKELVWLHATAASVENLKARFSNRINACSSLSEIVNTLRQDLPPVMRCVLSIYFFGAQIAVLHIENSISGGVVTLTALIVDYISEEVTVSKNRTRALREILDTPKPPIIMAEIILWAITKATHTEEVLGDFRETFETRSRRYGQEQALRWAHEQIVREIWDRISTAIRIMEWIKTAAHLLLKYFGV